MKGKVIDIAKEICHQVSWWGHTAVWAIVMGGKYLAYAYGEVKNALNAKRYERDTESCKLCGSSETKAVKEGRPVKCSRRAKAFRLVGEQYTSREKFAIPVSTIDDELMMAYQDNADTEVQKQLLERITRLEVSLAQVQWELRKLRKSTLNLVEENNMIEG